MVRYLLSLKHSTCMHLTFGNELSEIPFDEDFFDIGALKILNIANLTHTLIPCKTK